MYIMCVAGAHGGQKKTLDPLELELQMFMNYFVSMRNQTGFSARTTDALNC